MEENIQSRRLNVKFNTLHKYLFISRSHFEEYLVITNWIWIVLTILLLTQGMYFNIYAKMLPEDKGQSGPSAKALSEQSRKVWPTVMDAVLEKQYGSSWWPKTTSRIIRDLGNCVLQKKIEEHCGVYIQAEGKNLCSEHLRKITLSSKLNYLKLL